MILADISPAAWTDGVNRTRDRLSAEVSNLDHRQPWEPKAYFQAITGYQIANAASVAEHVYLRHCEHIADLRGTFWNTEAKAPEVLNPQVAAFREAAIASLAGLLEEVAKLNPADVPDLVLADGLSVQQVQDLQAATREGFIARLRYLMDHAYQRGNA